MKIVLLDKELTPYKKYKDDAGIDLRAGENVILCPGEARTLSAGIQVQIPKNHVGIIKSRSSYFKQGIVIDGVIDCGYTGTVGIMCNNTSNVARKISKGDRIAQLVVLPCLIEDMEIVEELPESERGGKGFGSTGEK